MKKWKVLMATLLVAVSAGASAAGSATVTCGKNGSMYEEGSGSNQPVYLNVSYQTASDAGTPGLFWLGVISPDQTKGAVFTERGWETYEGGLYPFQSRHDGGLPGSLSMSIPFPNNSTSTSGYVGYSVYVGHGAYTAKSREMIANRRAALNRSKASLVARGAWNAELESDDRFIWSLIQKDMVDNGKYGAVVTIPSLNCYRSNH